MSKLARLVQGSLSAKLLVVLIPVISVCVAAGIGAISWRINEDVENLGFQQGRQIGARYAAEMEARLMPPMQVARGLAHTLGALKASGVQDRAAIDRILKDTLANNAGLFGSWAGFEPDAVDGRDRDFAGKPGSDASGRFLSYWSRGGQNGAITQEALVDYEDPVNGAYYQGPKKSGREVVTEPYAYPVNGKNVMMTSLAVPIIVDGKFVGVAGVDLGLDQLWSVLKEYHPFETGTLFLVSNEGNWAAISDPEKLTKPIVDTNAELGAALASIRQGQEFSATGWSTLINGEVLRLFMPVHLGATGTPWAVLVQLPTDKMMASAHFLRRLSILGGATLLVVMALVVAVAGRSMIGRPLARALAAVEALSRGDLAVAIDTSDRADEIGRLNAALAVFKDNAVEMERLRQDNERQKAAAEAERRTALARVADSFEASVKAVVQEVGAAASQMQNDAHAMSGIASASSDRATAVATAAEQASANVETVAAASEELSVSIHEIGRQVTQATTIAGKAVDQSRDTGSIVASLVESAGRINEVVTLINDIAGRTNLLALNATIEAARAGEAGKGFAVVAGEVKALATQTGRATGEIQQQVQTVQAAATQAVAAIEDIAATIDAINEISSAIATAVTQQASATQEIARNVEQAARGTKEVSSNIVAVTESAGQVGQVAGQVLGASSHLTHQSEVLRTEMERALADIRNS